MAIEAGKFEKKTYFKPGGVNTDRPCILKSLGKDENGKAKVQEFDFLKAILFGIERSEYEHEGKTQQKINYYFTDEEGSEVVSLSGGWLTNYNRDWLNRLANVEGAIGKVKILLYASYWAEQDKHITRGSIHHENRPNIFELVKGKYPSEEIPKIKYEEYKGNKIKDDEEANKFFAKVLDQVVAKLKFHSADEVRAHYEGSTPPESGLNKEVTKNFKKETANVGEGDDNFDDDVPF
jgi:hypothetical protein